MNSIRKGQKSMSILPWRTLLIPVALMPGMASLLSGASPQWIDTGGSITGRIFVTSLGNLYAFARGTDNALWTNAQTSPDGPWGAWTSLGGVLASDPAAEFNGKDALEAFVVGSDGALWTIAQSRMVPLSPDGRA
jgi:hypothetical protein